MAAIRSRQLPLAKHEPQVQLLGKGCCGSSCSSPRGELIKTNGHKYRDLAIADGADHIQAFYSRVRRQSHLGGMSPDQRAVAHGSKRRRKCQTPGNFIHSCSAIVES
jgi:hypothetical protein